MIPSQINPVSLVLLCPLTDGNEGQKGYVMWPESHNKESKDSNSFGFPLKQNTTSARISWMKVFLELRSL